MQSIDPGPPRAVTLAGRALRRAWDRGLCTVPSLDLEEIEERARRATGLDDYGDAWFRTPLAVLLRAVREEADVNPVGRVVAHVHAGKIVRDRLAAARWFAEHPEIRRRPLAGPVVVVGPMRSGTTRLHRLLAADNRFAHLRFFETAFPVPRRRRRALDFRPLRAALTLRLVHTLNPTVGIIHPTAPFEPEEELGLLISSAYGMNLEAQWRVPSYAAWCEQADATPAYRHLADLLRLNSWLRGEDPAKPWVLKTPQHALDLPALLAVFPDARLIFTHRDPAAVVASSCSLIWNHMRLQSDRVDRAWIGREWLRKTRLKAERMAAAREALPPGQVVDVSFDEMGRDWKAAMRRVYAFLGVDLAPAERALERHVAASDRARRFHGHRYRLEDYGLDAGQVAEAFAGVPAAAPPARAAAA